MLFQQQFDNFINEFSVLKKPIPFEINKSNDELCIEPLQVEQFIKIILKLIVKPNSSIGQQLQNNESQIFGMLQSISQHIRQSVCGKHLNSEQAVVCYSCSKDYSNILCFDCFDEEAHKGHDYMIIFGQGQCDCGSNVISPRGYCKKHHGYNPDNNIFKEQENNLNFDNLIAIFFFIFQDIVSCIKMLSQHPQNQQLQLRISYMIDIILCLMKYPNEAFSQVITNILIYNNSSQQIYTTETFHFLNSSKYLLPYCNLDILLNDFKQQKELGLMKSYPVIAFFMLIPQILFNENQLLLRFQLFLIQELISFHPYKVFLNYIYSNKIQLILDNVLSRQFLYDKSVYILEENYKINAFDYVNSNMFSSINTDKWFGIPFQSYFVVLQDDIAHFISTIQENQAFCTIQTRISQGCYTLKSTINHDKVESLMLESIKQFINYIRDNALSFPYIKSDSDLDRLFSAKKILHKWVLSLLNNAKQPTYYELYSQDNPIQLHALLASMQQNIFKLSTINLITKSLHYVRQTFKTTATAISVISNINKCAKIYLTKQIHVPHIQNEDAYFNTITQYCSGPRIYYCKLLQSFFSVFFIKYTNINLYNQPVELDTANQKLTEFNEQTGINIPVLIQLFMYFILQHLSFEENQYSDDEQTKDNPHQISFNFGSLNEELSGNITYKVHNYPILNDNLNWLACLINLQYLLIKDSYQVISEYIKLIEQHNPTQYSVSQCIAFITGECVKLLLTQSMLNVNNFVHLGEYIQYTGDILLGKGTKKIMYVTYYYYQLLQANIYAIQTQNIQNLTIANTLIQIFELYGFIDQNMQQFIPYYQNITDPNDQDANRGSNIHQYANILKSKDIQSDIKEGKTLKLLSDVLTIIFITSFKQLVINSPHEIVQLYALQTLIQFPKAKLSEFHNMFILLDNYNHNYFTQIHEEFTEAVASEHNGQENAQIYNTSGYSTHYKLKANAVTKIDEMNPFFINLNNILEVIYDLIKEDENQLLERINRILNSQSYIDIYTQDSILMDAIYHFLDVYFNIYSDYTMINKSQILQQNILYVLLMAYNAIKHNNDCKQVFTELFVKIQHKYGDDNSGILCKYNIIVLEQICKNIGIAQNNTQQENNQLEQTLLQQKMSKLKKKNIQNHQLFALDNQVTASSLEQYIQQFDDNIQKFILDAVNDYNVCPICQVFQEDKMLGNLVTISPSSLIYNFKNIIPPHQNAQQNVLLNNSQTNLLDHTFTPKKLSYYNFQGNNNTIYFIQQPIKDRMQLTDFNYSVDNNFVSAQIHTCHHFMDMNCFLHTEESKLHGKVLQCPICRKVCNAFLPLVETTNTEQMIKGILKVGSTLRLVYILKRFDIYHQQFYTYDYLVDLFINIQDDSQQFKFSQDYLEELKMRVNYQDVSKEDIINIYKNDLIILILSFIDAGFQNLIVTRQQILNDKQCYLGQHNQQMLINNAIICSSQMIFCAKYLFLYACNQLLFDYEVEKRRFMNAIQLSEDILLSQKEDSVKRLLLFRYNVLFSNKFEVYLPSHIENEINFDELASEKFIISKTLFLCNFMFLQEQSGFIQQIQYALQKLQEENTLDDQIDDMLDTLDTLETIQIRYQLFMLEKIKKLHSFSDLAYFTQKYNLKQNVLNMYGSKSQIPLFQLTRNLFHFNSIFKNSNLDMIQLYQNYFCKDCRVPRCICMTCNTEIYCVQCAGTHEQAFIQHNHQCNLIGAYYCPLKNIVFICNSSNIVYAQAGPYLSQTGEDDYGYTKNISVFLNNKLLEMLFVMINYDNTYLLDYTNAAGIKSFRQFLQFDLYKQADIPVI